MPARWTRSVRRRLDDELDAVDTERVYLKAIDTHVNISRSVLECGVCSKLLPKDFVTLPCEHSWCLKCIRKCKSNGVYPCPKCRETTTTLGYQNPIIKEVLTKYMREVPCGAMCEGHQAAEVHIAKCLPCHVAKLKDAIEENEAIKKNNEALSKKVDTLEESNRVLNEAMAEYVEDDSTELESDDN